MSSSTFNVIRIEGLVCPCNSSWGGLVPPEPCAYHSGLYGPSRYWNTDTADRVKLKVEDILSQFTEEDWYIVLAPMRAPEIMGELLIKLFWPLLGDSEHNE